jgi:hypothetical protein
MLLDGVCRQVSRTAGLRSGWPVLLLWAFLGLLPAQAGAAELTSIEVVDSGGAVPMAKVVVANAGSGRVVASGVTDVQTGVFTFQAKSGHSFVVAVHTPSGHVGSERIVPGEAVTVVADVPITELQVLAYSGSTAVVEVLDAAGLPVAGARILAVSWDGFVALGWGSTDEAGRYGLQIPEEFSGTGGLCLTWQDSGAVRLQRLIGTSTGYDEAEDWGVPTF